jgi:hypothetical protein
MAPGVLFSPRQVPGSMLRLSVPLAQHAPAWELMARLVAQGTPPLIRPPGSGFARGRCP